MAISSKKTKQCIHCNRDINVKYDVCPICGGQQEEEFEASQPVCPRCGTGLKPHIADDEQYDICPSCGGMWLDRDEFHRATRVSTVYKKVDVKKEYHRPPIRSMVEYIPCVRCGKLMNRGNFGKISGVIIDRCSKHGVWLDAGELEKIQHFIADGGLDKSRDREIQKNRAMIKELAMEVDQNSFMIKILHYFNLRRILFGGWH